MAEEKEADAEKQPRLRPITSIDALLSWEPGSRPEDLYCRASVPLRVREGEEDPSAPRVLACHDFKGGYGDDALACGVFEKRGGENEEEEEEGGKGRSSSSPPSSSSSSLHSPSPFRFTHWRSVDALVYFSHELVTIPPPGWTDSAHDNGGVLVLGTLIFEHESGLREAERAFGTAEAAEATAAKLAELCSWFGFDGWLFNVEVSFKRGGERGEGEGRGEEEERGEAERTRALVDNCLLCLRRSRELCRSRASSSSSSSSSSSLVLWYDSVTCDDGALRWQNGLTKKNAGFFGAADGIFTNYCWKGLSCLRESARLAEEHESCNQRSAAEVWVGADAFGRGSFGGEGSAGVAAAAAAAAEAGSSLAVFAPGWVLEAFEGGGEKIPDAGAWRARADEFWRGVDKAYRGKRRRRKKEKSGGLRLPLFSAFSTGAGAGWWSCPLDSSSDSGPFLSSRSRRVGGGWFSLGLADYPCLSSQRWGSVSVRFVVVDGERGGAKGAAAAAVRLSVFVAEAAVVRAGAEGGGDCEVGGCCSHSCCCSFDGGGALAVAVLAFGPEGAASRERSVEFELFGDDCESDGESGGEGEEGSEEVVAVRAWVKDAAASAASSSPTAVSLSLVVRGGGSAEAAPPPPSLLLPLEPSSSSPSSPPPPSSSSSCCSWRKHERSLFLRELAGRVSSVALQLSFGGGEGEGAGGEKGGGGKGRPLFAATLGAVALVPSSFRAPKSPVASRMSLRGHRALEWGCEKGRESSVKRWEVWRRRKGGGESYFLGATRAQRYWISGDDSLRRGDEVSVRAVFVDGGREASSAAGRVVVVVE